MTYPTPRAWTELQSRKQPVEPLYAFTPAEFERLWNYRLAIQAGYYTDKLRETSG